VTQPTDASVDADFPIKQGGIGAQQADTAAAGIAHLAGLGDRPPALRPVIQGMLLTGGRPLYAAAHVISGVGWRSQIYPQPPWPAAGKIVAEELGPYLHQLESAAPPSVEPATTPTSDASAHTQPCQPPLARVE